MNLRIRHKPKTILKNRKLIDEKFTKIRNEIILMPETLTVQLNEFLQMNCLKMNLKEAEKIKEDAKQKLEESTSETKAGRGESKS